MVSSGKMTICLLYDSLLIVPRRRVRLALKSATVLKIHLEMEWVSFWQLLLLKVVNKALIWSGMGEVVLAYTSPTLYPPSPPTVL